MFDDGIVRVLLNWSRLREPEICVRQSFSRSLEKLGDLFTVWYSDSDGCTTEWKSERAQPMRVHEAAASEDHWTEHKSRQIADLEAGFLHKSLPVQLVLPAYSVGRGELLIIDGTHRSVAAYRAKVPVRLMLVELHGPVDADILPDLHHYSSQ